MIAKASPSGFSTATTVGQLIHQVFPLGTQFNPLASPPTLKTAGVRVPPFTPFDLFAVTALLLHRSGAYQRIVAGGAERDVPKGSLLIKKSELNKLTKIGEDWAEDPETPAEVKSLWRELLKASSKPLYEYEIGKKHFEHWWKTAYSLMAIADEASEGVGYLPVSAATGAGTWPAKLVTTMLNADTPTNPTSRHIKRVKNLPSITSAVDLDVACVQPKARTPDVGLGLRNLSHNLALLPPRGVMRVHWLTPPVPQKDEDDTELNLLLIPFPYVIEPDWFKTRDDKRDLWSWFDLNQEWLKPGKNRVQDLVRALLEQLKSKETIHAIVFPEYALDWTTYEAVADMLRDEYPNIQFLISGSSSNCNGQQGNYALSSCFFQIYDAMGKPKHRIMTSVSRPKHHRWSLDGNQIESYELTKAFAKKGKRHRWWESISVEPREIHINPMRSSSVFTAMICEDLARTEPAHEPLRSVGPNLIFVLLMDGPQYTWRWSARYSMGLVDDPGSSVLTITSRALVDRWNTATAPRNGHVGLWKDEENRTAEITCKPGAEAVLLKLKGNRETELTTDGRENSQTFSWTKLGDAVEISLDRGVHGRLLADIGAA